MNLCGLSPISPHISQQQYIKKKQMEKLLSAVKFSPDELETRDLGKLFVCVIENICKVCEFKVNNRLHK